MPFNIVIQMKLSSGGEKGKEKTLIPGKGLSSLCEGEPGRFRRRSGSTSGQHLTGPASERRGRVRFAPGTRAYLPYSHMKFARGNSPASLANPGLVLAGLRPAGILAGRSARVSGRRSSVQPFYRKHT